MVTFWLFCLAASALSSGRAAEEEERGRKEEVGCFRSEGAEMESEIISEGRCEEVGGEKGVKKWFI